MYKIFYSLLVIFWIFDILNLPFMYIFDTVYPINGLAWFLIWALLPTCTVVNNSK
nr:MAG TPA: hypothetical protein [Caudoviricetes sp.]